MPMMRGTPAVVCRMSSMSYVVCRSMSCRGGGYTIMCICISQSATVPALGFCTRLESEDVDDVEDVDLMS